MPELPEMETIASDLRHMVLGSRIISADVLVPRLRNHIAPNAATLVAGSVIQSVQRRAKYIAIRLDNEMAILLHLGMSGSLLVAQGMYEPQRHDHIILHLDQGKTIVFNDPRRFGYFIVDTIPNVERILSSLGTEPADLTVQLLKILMKRKRNMKTMLTDGSVVAGIGNIYASEILFHSRIRPHRQAESLTDIEIARLFDSIKIILDKAVKFRGSTIKDYKDSCGEKGGYQNEFLAYDCAGKPCSRCGEAIAKIKQQGRATYMCNVCQA